MEGWRYNLGITEKIFSTHKTIVVIKWNKAVKEFNIVSDP